VSENNKAQQLISFVYLYALKNSALINFKCGGIFQRSAIIYILMVSVLRPRCFVQKHWPIRSEFILCLLSETNLARHLTVFKQTSRGFW